MLEKGGGERRRVVDGWGDGFVNTAQSLRGRVEKGSFGVGVSVGGGDGVVVGLFFGVVVPVARLTF